MKQEHQPSDRVNELPLTLLGYHYNCEFQYVINTKFLFSSIIYIIYIFIYTTRDTPVTYAQYISIYA